MRIVIKIKPQEDRLDKYLQTQLKDLSRNKIHHHINDGHILVNSHAVDPDYTLRKDDKVDINLPPPSAVDIKPEDISLKIVYEDSDLVVIDKPAGLVVHPTVGHASGTLVNGLLFHWKKLPEAGESLRPGIVHRLDKDTSGLILVAKTQGSLANLKTQFENHLVKKTYLALVEGQMNPTEGTINAKIDRHPKNPMKFMVSPQGRDAQTYYKVLKETPKFSYLELKPKTGRTHQLRVHLSALGHPIVGDNLYGGKRLLKRQFLHATALEFTSPSSGEKLAFTSALPSDLQLFLDELT